MLERLKRWADSIRLRFDTLAKRIDSFGIVISLAAFTAAAMGLMKWLEPAACKPPPVRIVDLELTFSAPRFAALLEVLRKAGCKSAFLTSLITTDILFPIAYATTLCAIYIWAERQRRFTPTNTPINDPLSNRNHVVLLLPLLAGAVDILFENIPLWIAGTLIGGQTWSAESGAIDALVLIGSLSASIKWSLVLLSILGILAELMHNSRGIIIKRLRYSVIAVLIGALPLLVVPQGQDILQRTIEGPSAVPGIARALFALTLGAYVVWYCGRKLVQLKFPRDPKDARTDWYLFFGEHIPRILGIAVLVLGATAFARAGAAMLPFVIVALGGFVVAAAVKKFRPAITQAIGQLFIRGDLRIVTDLVTDAGRAVIALVIGLGILYAPGEPRDFVRLRFGAFLLLVITWLFYLYVYSRRERYVVRKLMPLIREGLAKAGQPSSDLTIADVYRLMTVYAVADTVSSVDPTRLDNAIKRTLIAGAVVTIVSLLVLTFWTVPTARGVGTLIVLSMAVASVVFFGSISTWAHERHRIPLAPIALVLAALFSVWNDSHMVRRITGNKVNVADRREIPAQFDLWRADSASGQVVLVAAAGGGLRAAYWTALSLAALQDSIPDFNRHLFAISSVSGGSVGATVYASLLHDSAASPGKVKCLEHNASRSFSHCVRQFMAEDYLSPVLAKMVAPDFVQSFLPFPWRQLDRSLALEGSWENSYEKVTGMPTLRKGFVALYTDGLAASTVPALFLNTTHVETGKRYITAPMKARLHDSQDLLELMGSDMPLSTAAHNSARFTYVSPPGRIQRGHTQEFGHVVDGGYFENSGLATLREILEVIQMRDSASRPIVVYLCNDPIPCKNKPTALPITDRAAVIEWMGPIKALLSTRDARGSLSRADIKALSKVRFIQLNVCDSLVASGKADGDSAALGSTAREKQGRERVISPPLGWQLSKVARDWMDSSLTAGASSPKPSECRRSNASAFKDLQAALARPTVR